jgi:dolichol-phosphate mannosyltransferase
MEKLFFSNIWLFLPCYNEVDNLEPLTEEILQLKIPNLHIAIIDDNSTDGTGAIANSLVSRYPELVAVIHRELPRGRARAGKDAYLFCLGKNADAIIEMDADFSHDPKYLPTMIQALSDNRGDVILGSRFLPGGSDSERSPLRTLTSKISGVIFRLILGLKLTDMGSGFKVYKAQVVRDMKPREMFTEKGLAISMESVFRSIKNGYRVFEIPIEFKERRAGYSKLSWKDFFDPILVSLRLVWKLGRAQVTSS